ncbi:antitoxin VapB family protein [Halopiger goleimassiliensis]|uniref:antitoxin VapB family protein n=1 Tax=Halopiger goleimassiliensis TaxID=1293048 RepID=UPI000678239A|nr:antitoxin VapB family protein [Halopiger goleimassiliensis]
MSSKTISLREETYRRLERAKRDDESFSDVVDRLLVDEENPFRELVGLLDEREISDVRRESKAFRAEMNDRFDARDTDHESTDGVDR